MSDNVFAGTMTLSNAQFVNAMNQAQSATMRALAPLKTMALGLTGLGAAFAALRGMDAVVDNIRGAFSKGRDLEILHRETGQSVTDLVELQKAFTSVKIPADSVSTALFFLNKALGGINEQGEPTGKAFARIGLSIAQLKQMNAVDQFHAIIQGMAKLPDQATRASVAMGIFGRSARDIQAILNDPAGFDAAIKAAGPMAEIMQKNAVAFEKVDKTIEGIQMKMKGFYAAVAAGLAPALQNVLDILNKINLVDIGDKLGRGIAVITQAFKDGKIGEMIRLSLTIAFKDAVNFMYGAIYGLAGAIDAAIDTLPERVKAAFRMLTNPNFWKGIGELMLGGFLSIQGRLNQMFLMIGIKFTSILQWSVNEMMRGLEAALNDVSWVVPGAGLAAKGLASLTDDKTMDQRDRENAAKVKPLFDVFGRESSTGDSMMSSGSAKIAAASAPVVQSIIDSLQKMKDAFIKGMRENKAFDTTADGKALIDIIRDLQSKIPQGATDPSKPPGALSGGAMPLALKMPESDRLAKLGLFVGGAPAAPGLSEAKRTAAATEKAAARLDQLVNGKYYRTPQGAFYH